MRESIGVLLVLVVCLGSATARAQPGGPPPGVGIPEEVTVLVDSDSGDSLAEALAGSITMNGNVGMGLIASDNSVVQN